MMETKRRVRLNPPRPFPPCQIARSSTPVSEVACQACSRVRVRINFPPPAHGGQIGACLLHLVKLWNPGEKLGFIRKSTGDSVAGM